jgi:hypothetical protein
MDLNTISLIGNLAEELKNLKDAFDKLEKRVEKLETSEIPSDKIPKLEKGKRGRIGLKVVREKVIEDIENNYPGAVGEVKGFGRISATYKGVTRDIQIKNSRSYRPGIPSGWFGVQRETLDTTDIFIFVIEMDGQFSHILFRMTS